MSTPAADSAAEVKAQPVRLVRNAAKSPAGDAVEQDLYEVRRKIHPRAVSGWFATWRWALVLFTQALFYGTAWLQWNDRQALLFDLASRKFYIFGLVFWPQDIIYLTILLILAALSLFLFTAVAGRLFCGYACPQTVYTEIFMWIERKIEGDRVARMKLDAAPLSAKKVFLRGSKHLVWIALALWTGLTFVGYFTPIRPLLGDVLSAEIGGWSLFWIGFYGFATYGNAGWMREQVCKYMCPYARFQSSMFDKDTLIITYDRERGEPRGSRSKKVADPRAAGLGDCVDCGVCVQVCPTGIDIRNGLQYECIGCAACIDGCNQIMEKMNYPKGLIRYSTENALRNHWSAGQILRHVMRPRTMIYAGILVAIATAAAITLAGRVPLKVDVIRDRQTLAREVEGGMIENVYRLQIMNTEERAHRYRIVASGIETIAVASDSEIEVAPATTASLVVRVHVLPGHGNPGSNKIAFEIAAIDEPAITVHEKSVFLLPRR